MPLQSTSARADARRSPMLGVVEHRPERATGEIGQRRTRFLLAQQRLRRHDHQRTLQRPPGLATQQVEVLGRRRAVGDAQIAFGRRLQEALDAAAGVLRTAPLVAMRQQQREPRRDAPLAESRRDELVEHHLRAVDEIAVLRFPEHQRCPAPRRHSRIRTRCMPAPRAASCAPRAAPSRRKRLERRERAAVLDVVQHRVTMRERAAPDVLAGQPHRNVLHQQRCERQRLGVAPVDAAGRRQRAAAPQQLRAHLRMDVEVRRPREQLFVERRERIGRNAGLEIRVGDDRRRRDRSAVPAWACDARKLDLDRQHALVHLFHHRVGFAGRDHAGCLELVGVLLPQRRVRS